MVTKTNYVSRSLCYFIWDRGDVTRCLCWYKQPEGTAPNSNKKAERGTKHSITLASINKLTLACPVRHPLFPSSLHIFLTAHWVFLAPHIRLGRGRVMDLGWAPFCFCLRLSSTAPPGDRKTCIVPLTTRIRCNGWPVFPSELKSYHVKKNRYFSNPTPNFSNKIDSKKNSD